MKIKKSVCIIQRRFRAYLVMKQTQKKYLTLKEAVITIQAYFRGYLMRHEYRKERAAIVKLQSGTRKFLCQRNYARLKHTVIEVQRRYRQKVCVARVKMEYLTTKAAVITIQAHYRRHLQQRDYKQRSVVVLQSAARGWKARRQVKQRKLAIIRIQAVVRKLPAVQRFQSLKKYTAFCQQRYKAKLQGRLVHHQYLALRQAAVTMQSFYRGIQVREMLLLKQESARRIQSWYRGRKQYILYTELRKSVLICQKTYRACRLAQSDQKKFLVLKGAALTIQAVYKGYKTRCMYQKMKQAIVLLQSGSRGFLERKRLKELHKAATMIQRVLRNRMNIKLFKQQEKVRQTYLLQFTRKVEIHLKATVIQRRYRKHASLCEAKKQLHSALIIQNWIKGRLCRIRFLKLKRSVHVIETAALQWIRISHDKEKKQAATKIQEEEIQEEKEKPKKLSKMKRFRKWLKRTFSCSR
ncbi:abnormal spindle-like microcephaly-associated protein homolog [Saccostrea echinata]|uniref:abnormal spindle-like microcephaly-associated protein homolog n=1 Tax=Saccostrea echinata TaxID=191078 RepID=UPI002A83F5E3|nr:abnormal spindle-like microcephaly-associated protein homolog [Saccostrea echinata]